ncbi:DNA/RNA polymerase [Meira miltonrushii]|uniref:DNA/RNA polymerase n=1 Tax=Meira miltonrushii TaxID=1280837 RepID=A0A316V1C5_9BASI|nr:DNA/RNA polymerase [Meira miltonrushii]PWN31272.1 DNA/RNA polymerase [Meira miltonrushii]
MSFGSGGKDGPIMARASHGSTASLSNLTSQKSTAPPEENPFPIVTYRHLLSAGSLTPSNPLRVIAHCDVDAAYAQFEAQRLGIDSFAIPLAVQQWSGLIAIGYKAREFGINRHCDITKAKELCPDIMAVHVQTIAPGDSEPGYHANPKPETHKVSLDPYRRESRKILATFKATCPLGQVEKASIDESYFDLTLEVRKLILHNYPHLKRPPETAKGMDEPLPTPPLIEWDNCGELMPIKRLDEDGAPMQNEDEFVPSQEHQLINPTWTDVALAHGAVLMTKVRKAVLEQNGYSTSAGIASNKTLAKLCSGYRKPNNQTTLLPRAVPAFLRDLPVGKIRFLGGKLGKEIGDLWDAITVGDLWSVPLESMQAHFGPEAAWVHAVLRGIDHSPVSARIANKTMLASKNLRPVIKRRDEAYGWLDTLSTELVARLREVWEDEHEASKIDDPKAKSTILPTLWPKFLVLRFIRVRGGPRSRQSAFPYVDNLNKNDVLKVAERLWNEACDEMRLGMKPIMGNGADAQPVEIVTIALGFSGLERAEVGQKTIEGFFGGGSSANKRKRVEEEKEVKDDIANAIEEADENVLRWKCDECGEQIKQHISEITESISPVKEQQAETEDFFDDENPFDNIPAMKEGESDAKANAQHRLDIQIQDHKDWHFAVNLSKQAWPEEERSVSTSSSPQVNRSTPTSSSTQSKKVKKPKKGSLQSFFAKQQSSQQ